MKKYQSKPFTQNDLVKAISLLMFNGMMAQIVYAENEIQALLTIQVNAQDQQTFANGYLSNKTKLGVLGEKDIIDTPFTVNTYTNKIIQVRKASSVAEVLKIDPSIRPITNQGHMVEAFRIRGFNFDSEDVSLNGMYGVAPTSRTPTEMIESIDVIKGPNALVAGMSPSGGIGGVINVNTKRADKNLTRISTSVEEKGYFQSSFDVARRFGQNNQLGVRTNFAFGQGERNTDGEEDRKALGTITVDYTIDKLKINFDAYAVQDKREDGSPALVSFAKLNHVLPAPKGDTNYFNHLDGLVDTQYIGLSTQYEIMPQLNTYAGIGYADKKQKGFVFGTRIDLKNDQGDADAVSYSFGSQYRNLSANAGLNYAFDIGALQHKLGVRADYLKIKLNQPGGWPTGNNFQTNLYDPADMGEMPNPLPLDPVQHNQFISYTISDQISILNDKLQLILGVRYQDMDLNNLAMKNKYDEDAWSPSIGITFKPIGESLSLYANYIEGLTQGDFVNQPNDQNYGVTFAPFKAKQFEIGTKLQAGKWLSTLALYQMKQGTTLTERFDTSPESKINQITTDGEEQRTHGVEWSVSGEAFKGLNLMSNITYQDAEYNKSNKNQGNDVYGIPKFTASLNLDYAIPVIEGLFVNTRMTHVSKQYLNEVNSLRLDDYTIFDAGARYKTKLGGVNTTLLFNVDNIANKKYWEGAFMSNYAIVGAERKFKVGVIFDF
jgi:iron complex outermembrane receptor protein